MAQYASSMSNINNNETPIESEPQGEEIDLEIAAEIMEDWDKNKASVEEYRKSKLLKCLTKPNPNLAHIEELVFPILKDILIKTLQKVTEEGCYYKQKSVFNGIDYISECLYNSNSKYPERMQSWTYIFDTKWATDYLQDHPRPFFPLSLLMSQTTAVRYIQAHMRGSWVRRRVDLQEMRTFWKVIKFKRESTQRMSSPSFLEMKKKEASKNKVNKRSASKMSFRSNH